MPELATSKAADPSLSQPEGGPEPPGLRDRQRRASRSTTRSSIRAPRTNKPRVFKNIGWAPYPAVDPGDAGKARRSAASTGASAATRSTRSEAFDAAPCMRNEENQKRRSRSRAACRRRSTTLYDDPEFVKAVPVRATLIREQLAGRRGAPADARRTPTCRWRSTRPLLPPSSIDPKASRPSCATGSRTPSSRRGCCEHDAAPAGATAAAPRARRRQPRQKPVTERAQGRAQARLDARARRP